VLKNAIFSDPGPVKGQVRKNLGPVDTIRTLVIDGVAATIADNPAKRDAIPADVEF
jgi:hypothetical protein